MDKNCVDEPSNRRNEVAAMLSTSAHNVGSASAADDPQLTAGERQAVVHTWQSHLRKHMVAVGQQVFLKIFADMPECLDMFDFGRLCGTNETALVANRDFKLHALRFMQVVDTTVTSVQRDECDRARAILRNIGHVHTRRRRQGFRPVYWTLFQSHLVNTVVARAAARMHFASGADGDARRRELQSGWGKLVRYVTEHMRSGYDEGIARHGVSALGSQSARAAGSKCSDSTSRLAPMRGNYDGGGHSPCAQDRRASDVATVTASPSGLPLLPITTVKWHENEEGDTDDNVAL